MRRNVDFERGIPKKWPVRTFAPAKKSRSDQNEASPYGTAYTGVPTLTR